MSQDWDPAAERSREILREVLASVPVYGLALAVMVLSFVAGVFAARLVRRSVARTGAHYGLQNLLAIAVGVVLAVVGLLVAVAIVGLDLAPLLGGVGVLGLVLGIALKDPLENFMAGIVLMARQPYTVGDRIVSNGIEGSVTEINVRSTVIKTYDGEAVHVPNGAVLRQPILNRTAYPIVRSTIDVRVRYEEDLLRAMRAAGDAVRAIADVRSDPAPEVAVGSFDDRGVGLQVRYWTDSLGATVNRVSIEARRGVKEAFDREGLAFATIFPEAATKPPEEEGRDGTWDVRRARART